MSTERMGKYYRRCAEGDFVLTSTEGTYMDCSFSQAYPKQIERAPLDFHSP